MKPEKVRGLYRQEFLSKKSDISKMLEAGCFLTDIHNQLQLQMPMAALYYYSRKYFSSKNTEQPPESCVEKADPKRVDSDKEPSPQKEKHLIRVGEQGTKPLVRINPNPNIEDLI